MKKKWIRFLLLIMLWGAGFSASGEEITKVGVIDITKVFNALQAGGSQEVKELMNFWAETEAQLGKIAKEISDLEMLKEKGKQDKDERAVWEYDRQIGEKKAFQRDYYRLRKLEYDRRYDALMKSSGFYSEMLKVIEYIAVRESYSLIFKNTDPSIMYYSKNVDITQDVIDYLNR